MKSLSLFLRVAIVVILTAPTFSSVLAIRPSDAELSRKSAWLAERWAPDVVPPASFTYGGASSNDFILSWTREESTENFDSEQKTVKTIRYREPNGPLEVEFRLTDYDGFPVIEQETIFRNVSDAETPILEAIRPFDAIFPTSPEDGAFVPLLRRAVGSPCSVADYRPQETPLPPAFRCEFNPGGGRSSNLHMPYFSLQTSRAGGWIFAIGWGGEWVADFETNESTGNDSATVRVASGQKTARFKLLPREEVSTPTFVLLAWERPVWFDAQNLWRAWSIERSLPRINGEVDRAHLWASTDRVDVEPFKPGAAFRIETIDKYLAEGIKPDYFHIDAGWYPCDGTWAKIGTWEVDETRYPNGVREVFDYAHKRGVGSVLWLEPERVAPGTWLTENKPEFVSNGKDGGLFKYHSPEAFAWILERVDRTITEQNVDFYRQDFNIDPLPYWLAQDEPDRAGITELKHVESYYRLWRELRRRHPNIKLDACASGGRRNDYLTMRYAVPLCRSDYSGGSLGRQVQSYGAPFWIPFTGSGYGASTTEPNFVYNFRSWAFAPYSGSAIRIADDEKYELLRDNVAIWREYLTPYFDDDYYPLTPCSLDERDWIGWQFNDAETDAGFVQMFRRPESPRTEGRFPLFGLNPDKTYRFFDVDSKETRDYSGRELLETGLPITCDAAPQAVVLSYRAVEQTK